MALDVLFAALVMVALFNILQKMEQWLHQHLFKVGWLVTKNLQTTTILYYTFFLPGVVVYELSRWLMAGVLNVRAEQAISFPEKQDIAELKLNFIRLHKKTAAWKVTLINAAPPLVGLLLVALIAVNVFDIRGVVAIMQSGTADAFFAGIQYLITLPDFYIWLYFVFTLSGTTIPNHLVLDGWRPVVTTVGGLGLLLVVVGLADDFGAVLAPPTINALNALSGVFVIMLLVNAFGVLVLSIIENTIERVTGDSAMFKNGKLIAMRRSEILALREQDRQKALKAQQQKKQKPALPAGPPSIYHIAFPIPGAPGDVPVTQTPALILESEAEETPALPARPRRQEPDMIPSVAINPARASSASINLKPPVDDDTDDDPDEDLDESVDEVTDDEGYSDDYQDDVYMDDDIVDDDSEEDSIDDEDDDDSDDEKAS